MSQRLRAQRWWAALISVAAVCSACQDPANPLDNNLNESQDSTEVIQFADELSVTQTADAMTAKAARVLVTLEPGEDLLVREAIVEWPNLNMDDEILRSTITGLDGDAQTITLALGGLVIDFAGAEEFLQSEEAALTREEFVESIRAALDGGVHPGIHVQRPAPDGAQDPDDAVFAATSLRLDDVAVDVLELHVDRDNLTRNATPPPDGWLTILGLPLELRITEGITRIRVERPKLDVRRFHGSVTDVDLDSRTFTLDDGTVIAVSDRTRLQPYFWAGHHRLRTLESVREAIEAGFMVRARGRGVVKTDNPLVLVAIHVSFRLDRVHFTRFRGEVASVDVSSSTFTLEDETRITLIGHSVVFIEGDGVRKGTLATVARAREDGHAVTVEGFGFAAGGDANGILAVFARFRIANANVREFSGRVTSVDLEASSFRLDDQLNVVVTEDTEIRMYHHDFHGLANLEAVQRALENGFQVDAEGAGIPNDDPESPGVTALKVRFEVRLADPVRFDGRVATVDVEANEFTLDDGTVVRMSDVTKIHPAIGAAHDILTLEIVARALEADLVVTARGTGVLVSEDPPTINAATVEFRVDFTDVIGFEGGVREVSVDNATVVLVDDTVIFIVEGTEMTFGDGIDTLEDVSAAVDAGESVMVRGEGAVRSRHPLTVVALRIGFFLD